MSRRLWQGQPSKMLIRKTEEKSEPALDCCQTPSALHNVDKKKRILSSPAAINQGGFYLFINREITEWNRREGLKGAHCVRPVTSLSNEWGSVNEPCFITQLCNAVIPQSELCLSSCRVIYSSADWEENTSKRKLIWLIVWGCGVNARVASLTRNM